MNTSDLVQPAVSEWRFRVTLSDLVALNRHLRRQRAPWRPILATLIALVCFAAYVGLVFVLPPVSRGLPWWTDLVTVHALLAVSLWWAAMGIGIVGLLI